MAMSNKAAGVVWRVGQDPPGEMPVSGLRTGNVPGPPGHRQQCAGGYARYRWWLGGGTEGSVQPACGAMFNNNT